MKLINFWTTRGIRVLIKESVIESKVCEYAKSLGWTTLKIKSASNNGYPDRVYFRKHTPCFFIEFKKQGKYLTILQQSRKRELQNNGVHVYTVDTVLGGKNIFNVYEEMNNGKINKG